MNAMQKYELEEVNGLDLQDEQVKERFKIEDLEQLNWALRKLATLDEQQSEIDELADKEMLRIKSWHEKESESIGHSKSFFESLVGEYAIKQRDNDPKFKNVKTPYGKVGFRKQQPKWNYDDEILIKHLKASELTDLFKTKEEPKKAEIKKQFKVLDSGQVVDSNGEIVPGITVEEQGDKLDIKVGE